MSFCRALTSFCRICLGFIFPMILIARLTIDMVRQDAAVDATRRIESKARGNRHGDHGAQSSEYVHLSYYGMILLNLSGFYIPEVFHE